MRFRIRRVSVWDPSKDNPPWDGAEWVEGKKEFEFVLSKLSKKFYENISNPDVEDGEGWREANGVGIRTVPDNRWEIDVNTLDELVAIADDHGIIMYPGEIKIYDDYNE